MNVGFRLILDVAFFALLCEWSMPKMGELVYKQSIMIDRKCEDACVAARAETPNELTSWMD